MIDYVKKPKAKINYTRPAPRVVTAGRITLRAGERIVLGTNVVLPPVKR